MSAEPEPRTPAPRNEEDAPEARRLAVSAAPHLRAPQSIPWLMWTVSFTLLPALACALAVFGPRVLWVAALAIATALAAEAGCQALRRRPITLGDGSAFLTGLLVAFVLPVHLPWYVPVTASLVAIALVKQAFGGLGCNIWNPALMGRAFVLASWASLLTVGPGWPVPHHHRLKAEGAAVDAVTAATPLTRVEKDLQAFNKGKTGGLPRARNAHQAAAALARIQERSATPLRDLAVGRVGGCIGETSAVAILIGGVALIALGIIRWHVPVVYIATVALLSWALPVRIEGEQAAYTVWFAGQPLLEIFAGGLFLGAFYMATDLVTTPVTRKGLVIFALGCGILTVVIRRYGGYPEGVCYAILLMNTATPLIDRHTRPRVFGREAKG